MPFFSRVLPQPRWDAGKYGRVTFARDDHIVAITIACFLAAAIAVLNTIAEKFPYGNREPRV